MNFCNFCSLEFRNSNTFDQHLLLLHPNKPMNRANKKLKADLNSTKNTKILTTMKGDTPPFQEGKEFFKCHECDAIFTRKFTRKKYTFYVVCLFSYFKYISSYYDSLIKTGNI